jgi:hypothetical protein
MSKVSVKQAIDEFLLSCKVENNKNKGRKQLYKKGCRGIIKNKKPIKKYLKNKTYIMV